MFDLVQRLPRKRILRVQFESFLKMQTSSCEITSLKREQPQIAVGPIMIAIDPNRRLKLVTRVLSSIVNSKPKPQGVVRFVFFRG